PDGSDAQLGVPPQHGRGQLTFHGPFPGLPTRLDAQRGRRPGSRADPISSCSPLPSASISAPPMSFATADTPRLDFAGSPINKALTAEQKIELFRKMVRIRRFEQTALKYYNAGRIGGFLHLYIGQESVAVGTLSLCGENDHNITAYRCHGHAISVGMDMNSLMAELFGKATGCSKGKGGSMHFFAPDKNYWGGHGIVAGQTPLGLGLGYGLKYLGKEG